MSSMNVAAVSSSLGLANRPEGPADRNAPTSVEDVKKVAQQFEAIIVRQLLKPAIDPIMSGGSMGGGGGAIGGGGGGIYGYLLTDVLADSLSSGGQMGFSKMVEQQLTPAALKATYSQAMQTDAAATSASLETLSQISTQS